jgi:hypothetical protein
MTEKSVKERRRTAVRTAIVLALTAIAFYITAFYIMAGKGS